MALAVSAATDWLSSVLRVLPCLLKLFTARPPGNFRVILKIFSICPVASGYKAGNGGRRREFRAGRKKILSTLHEAIAEIVGCKEQSELHHRQ
jgi:hypothetical protein